MNPSPVGPQGQPQTSQDRSIFYEPVDMFKNKKVDVVTKSDADKAAAQKAISVAHSTSDKFETPKEIEAKQQLPNLSSTAESRNLSTVKEASADLLSATRMSQALNNQSPHKQPLTRRERLRLDALEKEKLDAAALEKKAGSCTKCYSRGPKHE